MTRYTKIYLKCRCSICHNSANYRYILHIFWFKYLIVWNFLFSLSSSMMVMKLRKENLMSKHFASTNEFLIALVLQGFYIVYVTIFSVIFSNSLFFERPTPWLQLWLRDLWHSCKTFSTQRDCKIKCTVTESYTSSKYSSCALRSFRLGRGL